MAWNDWLKKGAKGLGNLAYDITGADNYMQSWRDVKKGNLGGAFFNLAQGLGETALLAAPMAGSAGRVAQLASRIPRTASFAGKFGFSAGGGLPALGKQVGTQLAFNALSNAGGTGSQQTRTGVTPSSAANFRKYEELTQNRIAPPDGKKDVGGGSGIVPATIPKFEQVLPDIDPSMMQQLQASRGTAFADLRALENLLGAENRASSIATQQGLRTAGAQATGQRQDLGSSISEMGYGTSPAQLDVGAEAIRQQEIGAKSGVAGERTANLADYLQRRTAGSRKLSEDLARLQQMETDARVQASRDAFNRFYGGR